MKYNKIVLFFNIALILSTVLRFLQINYTIEFSTGFFIQSYETFGYFITAAIFVMALISGIFAATYYISPEKPPRKGDILGAVSFLPAITILFETFSESSSLSVIPLQSFLLKVSGIFAAAFFILYGLAKYIDIKVHRMAGTAPVIYIILRIISSFAGISSLAIISDYIYYVIGYCLILLFFINFLKLYNGLDKEYNFRKIFATGLASAVICLPQTVSHIAVNLFSKSSYAHISHTANLSLLTFTIFIISFIFTHFSKENTQ